MGVLANAREVFRVLGEFTRVMPALGYRPPADDEPGSLGACFEDTVERYPDNIMLLFEGRQWTYAEFNREINRLAHLLQARGIGRGDTVALLMENRAEFVMAALAIVKLGAGAALINNSLGGAALVHCLQATGAAACIVGEERVEVLDAVRDDLELRDLFWFADRGAAACPDWAEDAGASMTAMSTDNLPVTREISAGETAFYIFTSGTTGLPKAAITVHRRLLGAGQALGKVGFRLKPEDRLYLCLPIYHITGMGPGFCGFIAGGGSIFLRRSFSASSFWREVREYNTNCFIYVGELCRYLANQPVAPEEKDNPLEKMMGNGLRPDVWDTFKTRFGVSRISEIYGSSEGNVTFVNLLNKDRTIGAAISKVTVVRFDTENNAIIRNSHGRCIEVDQGEPGLLLGEINQKAKFEGYTNKAATESKIVRDVMAPGDAWFNTGDLVKQVDVGFALGLKHYQFVDRTGDTFRWRAENVSTNEVGEILNSHPQISMANVYGVEVPGVEGRAGMVAFELPAEEQFDIESFQAMVERELPPYAQPVFIRLLHSAETTVTFKLLKGNLREEAYHPDRVGEDTIYVRKPRSPGYELLDDTFYRKIMDNSAGY